MAFASATFISVQGLTRVLAERRSGALEKTSALIGNGHVRVVGVRSTSTGQVIAQDGGWDAAVV